VTIDAIGCQTEIANKIVKKKADYVFALKGNQPNLLENVSGFFETELANGFRDARLSHRQGLLSREPRHSQENGTQSSAQGGGLPRYQRSQEAPY